MQRTLNDGIKFTKIDYPNAGVMISTPKLFGNCNRSEYYVIQMIDIHKHKIKYRIETLQNEYIEYTRFKIKILHQFPTPLSPILGFRTRLPSYLEYHYLLSNWGASVPGIKH